MFYFDPSIDLNVWLVAGLKMCLPEWLPAFLVSFGSCVDH